MSPSKGKGILGAGTMKLLSLVPAKRFASYRAYGDHSFTARGFLLTFLGTFLDLATLKTSILQTPSAASRLLAPLPFATPATFKPGYEYVLPPSPTSNSKSFPNGNTGHQVALPLRSPRQPVLF